MNYIRHLSGFFIRLADDERMTPYHISLYFALFQLWNEHRFGDRFVISRSEMMQLSRIGSANTYARCMKELSDWGYIFYTASSNLHSGSRVSCVRFDAETDTSSDTTTDTGSNTGTSCDLKSDTGTDTASDTGITANIKPDTARNTADQKNDPAGLKNDTSCDTGSDTLLINIINKNKQEENRETRNQKDDLDQKEKNQKQTQGKNSENLSEEKFQVPDFPDVGQFFDQNQFPRSEAQKFYRHYQSAGWKTGNKMKILSWQAVARKWMINSQSLKNDEREPNQVGTGKLSVTVNKDYSEPL